MNETQKIFDIYINNYHRNHSKFLNIFFNLSENGIDYYNQYNIGFEFKESFSDEKVSFKLPKKQLILSDFIVFCFMNYKEKEFYIHKSKHLLSKYNFNKDFCYPSKKTVKRNYIFKTKNIKELKIFIKNYH